MQQALYFGEGCYAIGEKHTIYACSIDVLPAGGRMCRHEPADGYQVVLGNPRLAPFERDLNRHRCHDRWKDQLSCDPVHIEARPIEQKTRRSILDVGTLRATRDLSPSARADIFSHRDDRLEFDAVLCATRSGHVAPSIWYFIGHGTSPFYQDILSSLEGESRSDTRPNECTKVRVLVTGLHCTARLARPAT